MTKLEYIAEPVETENTLTDIRLHVQGKTWHLWGRSGTEREAELAAKVEPGTLPVLLGAGLGHAAESLLKRGLPVAIVDREDAIDSVTGFRQRFEGSENLLLIDEPDPRMVLERLSLWREENGGQPLAPVILPLYLRLDRDYYGALAEALKAAAKTDFWSQARYPKFQDTTPKVLFFDANYFLCGEIRSALDKLAIPYRVMELEGGPTGSNAFIEELLSTVVDFRPDFVLTVNHFGLDREGRLAELLGDLGLPLASWFVDNPHLILHEYARPATDNTALFTYDAGNLQLLHDKGFDNVHYLPLATDPDRFKLRFGDTAPHEWPCDISFVGNSMASPVARCLEDAALPPEFAAEYRTVAGQFGDSIETGAADFLRKHRPEWYKLLTGLADRERKLAIESLLTWEATRQYRLSCVRRILPFNPTIVGDEGWQEQLGPGDWRHMPGLDYYTQLSRFYPHSKVNFNCTSRQMIGAVNQRVFDVPACGGFLLTDYREQMEDLFDLDSEVAVYHSPEEIPERVRHYLDNTLARKNVTMAARKRILAHHTYAHRLSGMLEIMRKTFG
ncbi:glycosyltransferase [Pseudodesulfovibrio cashew]|uniref:Glycosyltransferase n=1 Tax=Pseudodesulfovibrio cashew TaxID=2678688 RepID=A0A6I6JDC3_9BACT|nr:glycosyltransferase [Pseudodesulfovibrio cashew]QGY40816.1 glycosyltransferase [Pseudodesulfovibrio cashew]